MVTIPYQSSLSEEGWHWLDVGFPPDVFIIDVVLIGIESSSPYSQQSNHIKQHTFSQNTLV